MDVQHDVWKRHYLGYRGSSDPSTSRMQSLSQILVVQPGALLLLPDGEAGRLYGVMEAGLGTGYRTLGAIHTGFS